MSALSDIAGWVAPAATMIAAMMTAANLGARLTGWGFVVFTVGSVAWTTVGLASGQTNLVASNAFLTIVNLVGIWRWLGREVRYRDDAEKVAEVSAERPGQTLTPAGQLIGHVVNGPDDQPVARVVDAMVGCGDGRIRGLLISHGGVAGVGEQVAMLPSDAFVISEDGVRTRLDAASIAALPEVEAA